MKSHAVMRDEQAEHERRKAVVVFWAARMAGQRPTVPVWALVVQGGRHAGK